MKIVKTLLMTRLKYYTKMPNLKNLLSFKFSTATFLLVILSLFLHVSPIQAQTVKKIKTIIIDPGHGGSDHGAHGEYEGTLGSREKDITLAISMKLVAELKKQMPDVIILPTRTTGRNDLGVWQRQIGLHVLQATRMPAILIETGFIANYEDERYLNSEKGQQEIAEAITKALLRYKASVETPRTKSVVTQVISPDGK